MPSDRPDIPRDGWIARRDRARDGRVALVADGTSLTYGELAAAVDARAAGMHEAGVRPGDVAVLDLRPGLAFAIAFHALNRLRVAALPLNPRLSAADRARAIDEADPTLVVGPDGALQRREADSATSQREDPIVARILTSGTSGAPRQIQLSRGNFEASASGTAQALGTTADERWLCCMPLFHVGGLSILTRAAITGTAAEIHDGFDPRRVVGALGEGRVTGVSLVATQLKRLLDAGADLSAPRAIVVGGGPLPRDLLEEALGHGAAILQTYGLTEACSQVTILRPGEALAHIGSSGRPIPGVEVRIAEEEILVRGANVANASLAADGWLHTGDVGHVDDGGYLYVTDRLGDMIISGGENVSPTEIEEVLRGHATVADVAVVGREDPEWGEAVTAVVVPAAGTAGDPAALRAHAATRLAPHQVPKRYEFRESLPRTASGKLRRRELR